jgi:REP-associated tyrosine transposase
LYREGGRCCSITVFHHKNIRLAGADYKGRRWHFLTMCCEQRRRVFSSPHRAESLIRTLQREAVAKRFGVHAYCVMPEHLHILVAGLDAASDLLVFLKNFKQKTGYEFKRISGSDLWQKKFYDHILRPRDSVDAVAAYIWMNPVRRGLCTSAKSYPYSGSFVLDWASVKLSREDWVPSWKTKAPAFPVQSTGTHKPRKAAAT